MEVHTLLRALAATAKSPQPSSAPRAPSPVLLDVGENIGAASLVAAAVGHTVYAFEGRPRNLAAMHQTLCWNPELQQRMTVRNAQLHLLASRMSMHAASAPHPLAPRSRMHASQSAPGTCIAPMNKATGREGVEGRRVSAEWGMAQAGGCAA
jgi:hypothetical protein